MISKAELLKLDVEPRLKLIEEIWDSIASDPNADLPLTDAERLMLDARLRAHEETPDATRSWAEVRAEVIRRR